MTNGGVYHLFGAGFGVRNFFVQLQPIVHVRNEFDLDPKLRAALRDAEPFVSNTRYGLTDDGVAQAALAFQAGIALRAFRAPPAGEEVAESEEPEDGDPPDPRDLDPRRNRETSLYLGAAPKYLLGMAYGQVGGDGGVTTGDTLFGSSDPVAFDMVARTRYAAVGEAGGAGHGYGADLGAVLFWNNFEIGVGMNDVASEIHWETTVKRHVYSDSLNEFVSTVEAVDEDFTSRIPVTTTINVAKRMGPTTIAADVVDNELYTGIHLGAETWVGMVALRAGTYRDSNGHWLVAGGTGIRFGGIGLDLAVASHRRNVEESSAAELSASLTLY